MKPVFLKALSSTSKEDNEVLNEAVEILESALEKSSEINEKTVEVIDTFAQVRSEIQQSIDEKIMTEESSENEKNLSNKGGNLKVSDDRSDDTPNQIVVDEAEFEEVPTDVKPANTSLFSKLVTLFKDNSHIFLG